MEETQRPATTNVDLPHEIQRLIFEMAARSPRGAGFNLTQVAHYVYTWFIATHYHRCPQNCSLDSPQDRTNSYERIEIPSSRFAWSLLQTIRTKDRAFLDSTVRALAVSGDLNLRCAKLIFAACSQGIVSFSAWGNRENPSIYSPYSLISPPKCSPC